MIGMNKVKKVIIDLTCNSLMKELLINISIYFRIYIN